MQNNIFSLYIHDESCVAKTIYLPAVSGGGEEKKKIVVAPVSI